MNELEKRAAEHMKKQNGLSPFCTLGEATYKTDDESAHVKDNKLSNYDINWLDISTRRANEIIAKLSRGSSLVIKVTDARKYKDDTWLKCPVTYIITKTDDYALPSSVWEYKQLEFPEKGVTKISAGNLAEIISSGGNQNFGIIASASLQESLSEKKKKSGITLNRNAGNVKLNTQIFNKMNNSTESPSTNPISGPFGGDVGGGEAMGEAVEKKAPILYVIKDSHGNILSRPNEDDDELWDRVSSMEARGRRGLCVVVCTPDMLKKEELEECLTEAAPKKETVELEYKNLEFTQYGTQRDVDDWDEWEVLTDWTYKVSRDDIEVYIIENLLNESDIPNIADISDEEVDKFVTENFDSLFTKYEDEIKDYYHDDAVEDAQERYEYEPDYPDYDPYDEYDLYEDLHPRIKKNSVLEEDRADDDFDLFLRGV